MNHHPKTAIVLVRADAAAAIAAGLLGFVYGTGLVVRGVSLSPDRRSGSEAASGTWSSASSSSRWPVLSADCRAAG
jgi:hypothetical protein